MGHHTQIFAAPSRYVQGPGAIRELGDHVAILGRSVLVVGGKTGLQATRTGRAISFENNRIRQFEEQFTGESSDVEIARLTQIGRKIQCDVILACGGGKVIDTVKATAEELDLPSVIIPTVASNDAPCSALSVLYNEDGSFNRLRPLKRSPSLVLVDTEIIASAPVRQLVSGMGDALATWFEADACRNSHALNNFGGHISMAAIALAKLCLDTLLEHGVAAKRACVEQVVTPALEKVVEANTLLSGVGFESGGVALAHALSEGFSVIPEMHTCSHGETVAFGLLAQLIMEERPTQVITDIYRFCIDIGLPVTLSDLVCDPIDNNLLRLAADTAAEPGKPSHNLSFPITGDIIYNAVIAADALGRKLKMP